MVFIDRRMLFFSKVVPGNNFEEVYIWDFLYLFIRKNIYGCDVVGILLFCVDIVGICEVLSINFG